MIVKQEGMMIFFIDLQLKKARLPIDATVGGIVICVNNKQLANALSPIVVTLDGIVIVVIEKQSIEMEKSFLFVLCVIMCSISVGK